MSRKSSMPPLRVYVAFWYDAVNSRVVTRAALRRTELDGLRKLGLRVHRYTLAAGRGTGKPE